MVTSALFLNISGPLVVRCRKDTTEHEISPASASCDLEDFRGSHKDLTFLLV